VFRIDVELKDGDFNVIFWEELERLPLETIAMVQFMSKSASATIWKLNLKEPFCYV